MHSYCWTWLLFLNTQREHTFSINVLNSVYMDGVLLANTPYCVLMQAAKRVVDATRHTVAKYSPLQRHVRAFLALPPPRSPISRARVTCRPQAAHVMDLRRAYETEAVRANRRTSSVVRVSNKRSIPRFVKLMFVRYVCIVAVVAIEEGEECVGWFLSC